MKRFLQIPLVRVLSFAIGGTLIGCMLFVLAVTAIFSPPAPHLKAGSNWIPPVVGGPLEIRPLPPIEKLPADYATWLKAMPGPRARLYEVKLTEPNRQSDYRHEVVYGKTPLGRRPSTFISFHYESAELGGLEIHFHAAGKQDASLLKIQTKPLRLLLEVSDAFQLNVEPIEGIEAFQTLVATAQTNTP